MQDLSSVDNLYTSSAPSHGFRMESGEDTGKTSAKLEGLFFSSFNNVVSLLRVQRIWGGGSIFMITNDIL